MHTIHQAQVSLAQRRTGPAISQAQIDAIQCASFGSQAEKHAPPARAGDDPATRVDDGDADHWRRQAGSASDNGDPTLALSCWAIVSRLQPQALDALFHQGCCHALIDQPARAYLAFDAVASATAAPPALRQRAAELARLVDPLAL